MKTVEEIIASIQASASAIAKDNLRLERVTLNPSDFDRVYDDIKATAGPVMHGKPAYEASHFMLATAAGMLRVEPDDALPVGQSQIFVAPRKRVSEVHEKVKETLEAHYGTKSLRRSEPVAPRCEACKRDPDPRGPSACADCRLLAIAHEMYETGFMPSTVEDLQRCMKLNKTTVTAMDAKEHAVNEFGYGPARCAYERTRIEYPNGGEEARDAFWRFLEENRKLLRLDRPQREDYVRASVRLGEFVFELGVEHREGDDCSLVRKALRNCVVAIFGVDDAMRATQDTDANIVRRWPDRAYFVEIWQGENEGLTQSYQPYGRPRNR